MKTLVVYYSLSGTSRELAETIARQLGADVAEIRCKRYSNGPWGVIRAVYDGVRRRLPPIERPIQNVADYDIVVAGGPIWASHPATPLRRFLRDTAPRLPQTAFFLTHQGSPPEAAFEEMAAAAGKRPLATLVARKADLAGEGFAGALASFVAQLQQDVSTAAGARQRA